MLYHTICHMWMTYSQEEIARRHRAVKELLKQLDLPAAVIFSRDGVMKSWLYGERTHGYDGAGDILIADGPSYCVSEEFLHFRMLDPAEDLTPLFVPRITRPCRRQADFPAPRSSRQWKGKKITGWACTVRMR